MHHRLACLFLTLILSVLPVFAAPRPPLPEKLNNGDAPPNYPAEAARRTEAAKARLEQGDLDGAAQEIDRAFQADTLAITYFYQAVLFYRRGEYEKAIDAATYGEKVLEENILTEGKYDGDDEQLQRFKELTGAIQAKRESVMALGPQVDPAEKKQEFDDSVRAGDEAYGKGLLAKAAAAYAKAFRADPTQGEIGLRAATLYGDRLKNLTEAALLWQQVLVAGEPHATTARAELQSHREALDALLQDGLARREQWRNSPDATEPLRLAQAFPESAELQIELALLFARKGLVNDMIGHLQSASRLGLSAEDFLARTEFTDYFARAGGLDAAASQPLVAFVRDAYGEEPLAAIRTELKRRADETVRLAREKAEKERQARLAAERKDLTAWRDIQRSKTVQEANRLLSARNDIEVEMTVQTPDKKKRTRVTNARSTNFAFENGVYHFTFNRRSVTYESFGNTIVDSQIVTTVRSFASMDQPAVYATSWAPRSLRLPSSPPTSFLPAASVHRELCKEVYFTVLNAGAVHTEKIVTHSSGERLTDSNDYSGVSIYVMLTEQEAASLIQLLKQLQKLDAAGDNLEQLRQLRQ